MRGLVRACHPGPTAVVTAIAVLLGVGLDLDLPQLLLVGLTVLVGQLSIGWSNDWLDAERDAASARADKPAATGDIAVSRLRAAAAVSAVVTVPLSFVPGWRPAVCHLLLVGSGWVYNLGLKRSAWSPLPFLIGFGALPAYVALVGDVTPEWWLVSAGALLGVSAHFANAAPDIDSDRLLGVWGAPQHLGARGSLLVSLAVLAVAGLVAATQLSSALLAAVVVVLTPPVVGTSLVLRGQVSPVFPLVMAAAVIDVVMLVVVA